MHSIYSRQAMTKRANKNKRPRKRRQATPLTPQELRWLKRRRPLWSIEAARLFETAGIAEVSEPRDPARFVGKVARKRGRPPAIDPDIAARACAALEVRAKADATRKHGEAVAFLGRWFSEQNLDVPSVGQLNRAVIWRVLGKTKRGRRS
jgi:hypothetical protein